MRNGAEEAKVVDVVLGGVDAAADEEVVEIDGDEAKTTLPWVNCVVHPITRLDD